MKAIILAAGDSERLHLSTNHQPKPLINLLGLKLIERVIKTAKQVSINEFIIVVGFQGYKIKNYLGDGNKYDVKIDYIDNKRWNEENGLSLLSTKNLVEDNFILLMADHIFDVRILKEIIRYNLTTSVVLAIDKKKPNEGDTIVIEEKGKIKHIGKELTNSNAIDTGIFLCSPKLFSYAEEAINEGKTELSAVIQRAADYNDAEIFDITTIDTYISKMRQDVELWWLDIDTSEDLNRAKHMIIENASKNPSDVLATYIHKPIENKIVSYIANFKISPNQITIFANILAYTATILFFTGFLLYASIITFLVGIVDGLDGKLARVKLQSTKLGLLEHSFDLLFEFSWIVALSLFLFRSTEDATALFLALLIIVCVSFYRHIYDQFRKASGISLDDFGYFERKFKRIAGRRNLFNVSILSGILIGKPIFGLYFIAFHALLTAVIYASRAIKHLRFLDATDSKSMS
ncbi:MAG: sugar phosphate nucleotidyltransferase [Candidatus Kariarchaeaceae archaeon]